MMKKITFLLILLISSASFGQNLVLNGDFETGDLTSWLGFNRQVLTDDITSSSVANINNGEGSLFQVVTVTPGETYNVSFEYRWVSGSGNYEMTVRVREDGTSNNLESFSLDMTPDVWHDAAFSFTVPTGITSVRLLFYKGNGNRPLRMDNASITLATTASVDDLAKFGFKSYPNPVNDIINFSSLNTIEKVEIFNLLGQKVTEKTDFKNNEEGINVATLKKGVYVVKVKIENSIGTYKIIKN
jgi:hypothetical protein